MNARHIAVKVLTPLLNQSGALKYALKKQIVDCPENQRPFLQELCYGTMRHHPQLSLLLSKLIAKPLKAKDQDINALIMIGLYQLLKLRVAEHAAISETVDICKILKKPWATSLVNATLRNFQRNKEPLLADLSELDSFKYNHPAWFIAKLRSNWPDHWQSILTANDQHPPLVLRVNKNKVSRETLISKLAEEDHQAHITNISEYGVQLDQPTDVTMLPGFDQGEFSVQDEAAQLAAALIAPQENENILDACSAPGGKLIHLLELRSSANTSIQGIELEQHRADKIIENMDRIELSCKVHIANATNRDWWDGVLFDKILLDAPCSATGVIRRNPDIKLLRQPEDIHSIAKLQKAILANLWSTLAPGGTLIYATCSIFPQENEKIISAFIRETDDADHIEIDANWGLKREYGRQLFPEKDGNDGFYYAMLKKRKCD
ncbi:MAG: sun protein [Osedax symbiont Rs1]|nr:MAG: sun protein [Osedax symbiont Rs1]